MRDLVLIPSRVEQTWCEPELGWAFDDPEVAVRLCGWGVIQSAVVTTRLLLELKPRCVWLLGIAGALRANSAQRCQARQGDLSRPELRIGQAYEFTQVSIDGIGVGQGGDHVSFEQLGWSASFGGPPHAPSTIRLDGKSDHVLGLLTVCSASANAADASRRVERYPEADAEDMESYSIAFACHHLDVGLRVVRGISNMAGNRDIGSWRARQAMQAAARLTKQLLQGSRTPSLPSSGGSQDPASQPTDCLNDPRKK